MKNKRWNIALRILVFIPICLIVLIGSLLHWVKICFRFAVYGGEIVFYNDKREYETISDIYKQLKKNKNTEVKRYDTVIGNVDVEDFLNDIKFEDIGSGWYENKEHSIRIKLWINCGIDFWYFRSLVDEDDNKLVFRGEIYCSDDVLWVLDRCFNYAP